MKLERKIPVNYFSIKLKLKRKILELHILNHVCMLSLSSCVCITKPICECVFIKQKIILNSLFFNIILY